MILRLDKLISSQTSFSRKEVSKILKEKRVLIDEKICVDGSIKVDTDKSKITLDGKTVEYKQYVYYMMNKPSGVVCATEDKNDKTVLDLLNKEDRRDKIFPAGRLDKDTTGFVLLTDDGEFSHNILSPSKHTFKTYIATVDKPLKTDLIEKFKNGIELSDKTKCKEAFLEILDKKTAKLKISEGKFHQVKKMFLSCSYEVQSLKRIAMGNLSLDESLKEGEYREISLDEIKKITG